MIIVIAVPSEDGKDRKVLAALQHWKQIGYQTATGAFRRAPITYAYPTTTNRNSERVLRVLALHVPRTIDVHQEAGPYRVGAKEFTYCSYCSGKPEFPCKTVRILNGMED